MAKMLSPYTLREIANYLGYTRECEELGLEPVSLDEYFEGPS